MEHISRRENGEWKKWYSELEKPFLGTAVVFNPFDNNNFISFENGWISKSGNLDEDFIVNIHKKEKDVDFNFLNQLEKTGMFHYEIVYSPFDTPVRIIFHPAMLSEIRRYD